MHNCLPVHLWASGKIKFLWRMLPMAVSSSAYTGQARGMAYWCALFLSMPPECADMVAMLPSVRVATLGALRGPCVSALHVVWLSLACLLKAHAVVEPMWLVSAILVSTMPSQSNDLRPQVLSTLPSTCHVSTLPPPAFCALTRLFPLCPHWSHCHQPSKPPLLTPHSPKPATLHWSSGTSTVGLCMSLCCNSLLASSWPQARPAAAMSGTPGEPSAVVAAVAVPKKRRLSANKANDALDVLRSSLLATQQEKDIETIVTFLRANPSRITDCKVFLQSLERKPTGEPPLPRGVRTLEGVPLKLQQKCLESLGMDRTGLVNLTNSNRELPKLFILASRRPGSFRIPEVRMPIEKFMEWYRSLCQPQVASLVALDLVRLMT